MKTIFLTALVALLVAATSFAGIVIKVTLSIGKKSQPTTCPNFGFCDFSINTSYQDGSVNGTLDVNEERGSMFIAIYEKDILKVQPDKIVYFKGKDSVIFSEDFVLPTEFNIASKVTKPLIIKKGNYPLTFNKGIYYIEFPL